ncbi:MAG: MBL fold metallo-hydrolase [Planctomycetes bacterium]|nr:MBL fold metallo-hydrolase [Planctomycetota bacterium]
MSKRLSIRTFALGEWMTNCYVLFCAEPRPEATPCWIIDAGFSPGPMIAFIREQKLAPSRVVMTHAHLDHIAGLHALRAAWPELPILIHDAEREFLTDPELNLSIALDEPITAPPATGSLRHGDRLQLDGLSFEVRHTPGHSPGGVSLYQPDEGVVFVGDALFSGSVGRTDFPTSNRDELRRAIESQLLSLPDATRVYPGHGPATTIGRERQINPYL